MLPFAGAGLFNIGKTVVGGTAGALLVTSLTGTVASLADVATGSLLASGGVGVLPAFSASPTLTTSLTVPTIYGGTGVSGTLILQSTTNATRGTVDSVNQTRLYTANDTLSAATTAGALYTGGVNVSTGSVTGIGLTSTITMTGNGAGTGVVALFNAQYTLIDNGSARTLVTSIIFNASPTYTATIAGGLILTDLSAAVPALVGAYFGPTFNRTGAGTGTATTVAAFHSGFGTVGTGFTVTNWIGLLIDKPTITGTLTNFYGVKNNGVAATNHWFLYETGGMQSSHKGKMRFGDNTAPGALVEIAAGAAGANSAPLKYTSGTNLTTAEVGAREYDGVQHYATIDTSSGRGALPVEQYVHLTGAGGAITTIANFFGATTNIAIVASAYYIIEVHCYFLKDASASVVTWTFTNSAAPTGQNIESEFSPITGIITGTPTATTLFGHIYNDATAAKTIATGSLSANVNHYCRFRIMLKNGTGTSLKIQATVTTGNITPGIGSWWRARRLSPNNIGTFAA